MKPTFKETNKVFHKILEVDGIKYILDMTTIESKKFFWGQQSEYISVKGIKVDIDNSFESANSPSGKTAGIIVGTVIGGFLSKFVDNLFNNYNISHNLFLKVGVFITSIIIPYIILRLIMLYVKYSIRQKISGDFKEYRIRFGTTDLEHDAKYIYRLFLFYLVVNLVCFISYLFIHDGAETIFFAINVFVSLAFFSLILGMLPLRESYEKQEIIFEKIEEI